MTPFALLTEIDRRCRSHAAALPQPVENLPTWRGVGFMLGGRQYVTEMDNVSEIIQPPHVTPVPGVRDWVMGVANVRGRLVPVNDMCSMLGLTSRAGRNSQRVLVVGRKDFRSGLLVDAVLGMQSFLVSQKMSGIQVPDELAGFTDNGFVRDGQIWPEIELDRLVESPAFLDIAI